MLFFIDESWQRTEKGDIKVGVLSAVQLKAHDFNECSVQIYKLKVKNFGAQSGNLEIKGKGVLSNYVMALEERGIRSTNLNLLRDVLNYMSLIGVKLFASVVYSREERDLSCTNVNSLERPFFFLFERINLFMEENYPGLMAQLIFDDRGIEMNRKISESVSNFFHKSHAGQSFDRIIKVPCFAISKDNIGLQLADVVAYILGKEIIVGSRIGEFKEKVKKLEFISRKLFDVGDRRYPLFGFKIIREKEGEAGDLFSPGRTE